MNYAVYLAKIIQNHPLVLVLFYRPNCSDSATMKVLLKLVQQRTNHPLKIVHIEVDTYSEATLDYALTSIPSCLIFRQQRLIFQQAGIVSSKEIIETIS